VQEQAWSKLQRGGKCISTRCILIVLPHRTPSRYNLSTILVVTIPLDRIYESRPFCMCMRSDQRLVEAHNASPYEEGCTLSIHIHFVLNTTINQHLPPLLHLAKHLALLPLQRHLLYLCTILLQRRLLTSPHLRQ
jgi:hypothetical protein